MLVVSSIGKGRGEELCGYTGSGMRDDARVEKGGG